MNPFSTNLSSNLPNPFSSGPTGSRTPSSFTSNPSFQSSQVSSMRAGFNPANGGSSSSGFSSQAPNPFASSSNPFTSTSNPGTSHNFSSGFAGSGQLTSNNFTSGTSGGLANTANPATSGFNSSFSGSSFTANRSNGFLPSGASQGSVSGNPFASSMGSALPISGGNPFSSGITGANTSASQGNPFSSGITGPNTSASQGNPFSSGITGPNTSASQGNPFSSGTSGVNTSATQGNPFSTGQGFSTGQVPFTSSFNTSTFSSSIPGATSAQFNGSTGLTSTPSLSNSGFFVSNANPFSSGSISSNFNPTGNFSTTSSLIPAFQSNFEEPGVWRFKKIDNFPGNMKKLFFEIQKSFDKNSDSLATVEKTLEIVKEKIKKTLETAERVFNYSTKVQTVQKRTKLTIEIVKKFESDIVGYVRDIIKVCEFCERADYYNQITSPATFVAGLLESCDKRLEQLDESLAQVEDMIKAESDPNSFREFVQVVSLMSEKFRIVAGLSHDVHVMVDLLYEKLKYRFKELQNFHPEVENVASQVKLEYRENKENSLITQFRPTGNIKDLISAYPSHSILK